MSVQRSLVPEQVELSNGLRVLLVENRTAPLISMNLTILAGARDDPESGAGTAMMASRLLEEGTNSRSSLEIADAIESVGGVLEADCFSDRTAVLLGVLSRDLDLGLDLVADIVRNPVFTEECIDNERERTLAEIRSAMDRPQVVAGWEFNELVYGDHPLHRPTHGYPETIRAIGRKDLVGFHERYFVPNEAILSAVGDFDAGELLERIESVFGSWNRQASCAPLRSRPAPVVGVKSKRLALPGQQAHIYLGHLGIERTHSDFYALQVMDAILGGGAGLTSRIPRKLRDDQGLAYTTFASMTGSAGRDPGKFVAYIATGPENIQAAIDGIMAEIETIRSTPVSDFELADAKAYLTGSFVFGFETNSQMARFLVNAVLFGLGFDYIDRYPAYVAEVTADAIQSAAEAHLSTREYVLVVASPEGRAAGN